MYISCVRGEQKKEKVEQNQGPLSYSKTPARKTLQPFLSLLFFSLLNLTSYRSDCFTYIEISSEHGPGRHRRTEPSSVSDLKICAEILQAETETEIRTRIETGAPRICAKTRTTGTRCHRSE